ncbi:MAG: HAD family hydrolase [Clostridia bacterium]|nr:HAD family hydrolase [Clostridia bacterium]
MYKALIFDLDGTLADTLPAILTALNATMRRFGYPEHDLDALRTFINNGARMLVTRAMPMSERNDAQIDAVLADYDRAYAACYGQTTETYPGITAAITALHSRGYRIAVLSNKQDHMVKGLCAQLLPGLIDLAIGQRPGIPTKPDPTVPLEMAAALGAAPAEIAFIGDSDVDIRTAQNAGFLPVGVAWGYRSPALLREVGAAHIVETADALTALFPNQN